MKMYQKKDAYPSKLLIFLSAGICLLPILIGLISWNRLPDPMAVHFDFAGNPDSWYPKSVAVFFLPIILVVLDILTLILVKREGEEIPKGMVSILLWIIPGVSLLVNGLLYRFNLGYAVDPAFYAYLFLGLVFLVTGNVLPKIKPNRYAGVRFPWIMNRPTAFRKTQRAAGYAMTGLGFLLILCTFVKAYILGSILIALYLLFTFVISVYYAKQDKNGEK